MSWFYRFIRFLLRLGLHGYFREVEIHGRENVPHEGPLMILANHHNGMIDSFLLIAACDRPVTFVAKATLFRVPVLRWFLRWFHTLPAYRGEEPDYAKEKNQTLFAAAESALVQGHAIGIFPEGRSHLDPTLLQFKHGASRIAFDAEAAGARVRVQLMGIHFEKTRGFRGHVLVQFGPPLTLDAHRERYAHDPRAATAALTEDLHARLSEMVLTAENERLIRLANLVERMGSLEAAGDSDLKGAFERKKTLLDVYARLRVEAPEELSAVRRALDDYQQMLDALGVRDDQIAQDYRFGRVLVYALRNSLALAMGLPFVALGLAGNLPPYLVAWGCSRFGGTLDIRTSISFLVAVVVFPLWWLVLGIVGWRMAPWGAAACLVAPVTGMITLAWMDRWQRVLQATWGLWTAIALRGARARLKRMRAGVLQRVERLLGKGRGS
ncbi:MAG: 1-acyl-sn-glycerol-3-phosphate acyltransferase [Planctomycetes bacterium]|nr:1-acyl-sn-glycerol-3-phosphate acyltransferase [Planctomycetota bacterium]